MKIYGAGPLKYGVGSAGPWTGAWNKGGYYIRSRSVPTNPNSVRQQATRNVFGQFAAEWTTVLSQAGRDAWNSYADSHEWHDSAGAPIKINGLCWYIMYNTRLIDGGGVRINTPPPGAVPTGYTTFSCDVSALAIVDVTFTPAIPADFKMQLWMTMPGTEGQTPNFRQARLCGYSGAAEASPWAAALPFPIATGLQSTFYACVMNDDGQISVYSVYTDLADY